MHRLAAFAISFVALSIGAAACSNPPQSDRSAAPPPASDQGYLPLTRFYDLIPIFPLDFGTFWGASPRGCWHLSV
jgi:hypothetical protein